jgi:putative sigma-54 modulation protein
MELEVDMAEEIELNGRNLEISDRLQKYVNKKVSKLGRYLPGIEQTRVDLTFEKSARSASDRQIAEITVRGKGFILRAEERSDDMQAAIDAAVDKIQNQINRFKGKRYNWRGSGRAPETVDESAPLAEEETTSELGPVISRKKKFLLTPMDELEALEQMKLLGHDNFFIFYNANTHNVDVIYRRHDGTYGLIETEVG